MNLQSLCVDMESLVNALFQGDRERLPAREDSRAFGAMLEKRVADAWSEVVRQVGGESVPRPGRRTIYDLAMTLDDSLVGLDVKTKDLDTQKYADGGVCSVDNLFRFLVNRRGTLLLAELCHSADPLRDGTRRLSEICVAPIHLLPLRALRIENLGTGQVRLNSTLAETRAAIDWNQDLRSFLDGFVELAIAHHQRVSAVSSRRIENLEKFRDAGYERFTSSR